MANAYPQISSGAMVPRTRRLGHIAGTCRCWQTPRLFGGAHVASLDCMRGGYARGLDRRWPWALARSVTASHVACSKLVHVIPPVAVENTCMGSGGAVGVRRSGRRGCMRAARRECRVRSWHPAAASLCRNRLYAGKPVVMHSFAGTGAPKPAPKEPGGAPTPALDGRMLHSGQNEVLRRPGAHRLGQLEVEEATPEATMYRAF